jgi:hypothetical protein
MRLSIGTNSVSWLNLKTVRAEVDNARRINTEGILIGMCDESYGQAGRSIDRVDKRPYNRFVITCLEGSGLPSSTNNL